MKKLIMFFAVGLVSVAVQADLLYWQVGTVTTDGGLTYKTSSGDIEYSYAKLIVTPSTTLDSMIEGKGSYDQVSATAFFNEASVAADVTDYTSSSFQIELYNTANELVGRSQTADYGSLAAYRSAAEFSSNWAMASGGGWGGGTYTAVPEPTSGLLMLIGAAMLGLRRRKMA